MNMFPDVVGQDEAKKKLAFYIKSYHQTKIMPNLLFSGQKGGGKTHIATEVGKQLIEYDEIGQPRMKEDGKTPKKKSWIYVNASSIESFRWLINAVLEPHCIGKSSTVFIDECSELKPEVEFNLLSLLNPNTNNRNSLTIDDHVIDIDFSLNTFLFATTNVEKVSNPLVDRLERIDLEPYSVTDLATIIQKATPAINYVDAVLQEVAMTVRQNARQAIQTASKIKTYLNGSGQFGKYQWEDLKKILSIHPLGLRRQEIEILKMLKSRPDGSSLNSLVSKTGLSKTALQQDYEMILMQHSLMEVKQGAGRVITGRGIEYLKQLELCPN
jgi:Holliday junction resolvasome RuvABC ATP-dependent DNA helicase subunit